MDLFIHAKNKRSAQEGKEKKSNECVDDQVTRYKYQS
jgi:hypothetical protein